MKCFHFPTSEPETTPTQPKPPQSMSSLSKLSWARSLSAASTSGRSSRRSRDFDIYSSTTEDFSSSSEYLFSRPQKNRLRVFGFEELKTATRGLCRAQVIGEGGFGCVYRGVVRGDDDRDVVHVAIKQLNRHGLQGHKEWINEVNLLGVIRHPNLVKLVGYCAEDDERGIQRLLVYELMKNKSLEDHLFLMTMTSSSTTIECLPWMSRLKIAQDAARGLAHLHEEMDFQLIFRDFKTSNVLLDEEFNAKLSDFGLARLGPPEGLGHVSTAVVGTVGYAAPEYVHSGRLTVKSDVWSFGVVLYELITGRRAVERNLPRGEQKLLEWVRPYASDSKKFHLILDPRLEGQYRIKSARKVASLANKCLTRHPKARPKMSEVVEILGNIIKDASAFDDVPSRTVRSAEEVEGETNREPGPPPVLEGPKLGGNRKKVFDIKELVNLRNRSIGKIDWRNFTPGLIRGGTLDIFGIGHS